MSDSEPSLEPRRSVAARPADEEFARAYADGYGEGLRDAFREMLAHASRGHTAQELRFLIQSRLTRLSEDVELKHKSLLAPPRSAGWSSLWRTPAGNPPSAPPPGIPRLPAGGSYLVREDRPARAVTLLEEAAPAFPRVVLISVQPPDAPRVPAERRLDLRPARAAPTDDGRGLSPSVLLGQLRAPMESEGGALVYLDALEFMLTEYGTDPTHRIVNWLVDETRTTHSALVVSFNSRALNEPDRSRLERAFGTIL